MTEYEIKEKIEAYINSIKRDPVIINWCKISQERGKNARQRDAEFFERMFYFMGQLAKGWILANACQTSELKAVDDYFRSPEYLNTIIEEATNQINEQLRGKN